MSRLLRLNPHFQPAFPGLQAAKDIGDKLLKTSLAEKKSILTIYLFGSAAEGKNTINSDLDLLVIIPDSQQNDLKGYYSIVSKPHFSPYAVDWIFKTESEFAANKDIGGVCRIAHLNGIKVWSNDSK